jgi:hypothetical protein
MIFEGGVGGVGGGGGGGGAGGAGGGGDCVFAPASWRLVIAVMKNSLDINFPPQN